MPASEFLRIHRSAIVSLRHIAAVEGAANGGFRVHVQGRPDPLALSRRYAAAVRSRLGA